MPTSIKYTYLWMILRFIRYNIVTVSTKNIYKLIINSNKKPNTNSGTLIDFKQGSFSDIKKLNKEEFDYAEDDMFFAQQRLNFEDTLTLGYSEKEPVFYAWLMKGN